MVSIECDVCANRYRRHWVGVVLTALLSPLVWAWAVLTALGLAGGLTGGVLLGMPLGKIVNAMIVTASVTCAVGAILGSFQAIGLRRLLRQVRLKLSKSSSQPRDLVFLSISRRRV